MTEPCIQSVVSMAAECRQEEEQSSGAEVEKSGEGSRKSVADLPAESSSSSERPERGTEEDELDGFPVLGAEEEDWDSSSSQKGRQSEEQDEGESESKKASQQSEANADDSAQQSRLDESTSQNDTSTSSQEPGGSFREETLYSPLMKIKDEPIDEDYDKALNQPTDISRVKEELENGEHELAPPPDELRISSVFSVRGASDAIAAGPVAPSQPPPFVTMSPAASAIKAPLMVVPAQPQGQFQTKPLAQIQLQLQPQLQAHLQPQLQLQAQLQPQLQPQLQAQLQPQLQPPPPPASIRICCSGCSKVLQKGQTAFQRKGSNQLFCSTVCLTGFTLPPAITIAPKKTCHLCLKVIGNPKDLITVPVDSSNTLKEFCSQACLTIYRSRVEGIHEEEIVRCSMCRNPGEIQHEVNHQGVLHRLCSDECFSRFRSSKRLSMSCCETCGNCTVTGTYHLVQVEDAVKKFCSPVCISTYKQKSGKRIRCPFCREIKSVDQMLEGTNTQGVIEFFCSSRCLTNSQASRTLSGASFPCTNCQKLAIPQYHLAMPDGSIRNFCSYECVGRFQEKLQKPSTQMNGSSTVAQSTTPTTAPRGPQFSSVASRPPVSHHTPTAPASYMTASSQNPPSTVPTSNQNPPYVSAPGLATPQDNQNQQPDQAPSSTPSSTRLTCKQCQKQFRSKPEVLQYKSHVGLFCSRLCCDAYKREKDVKAVCEYCKEEKVLKDITMYEHKPRAFCCEGCKLLFKHDLTKQRGGQCRTCAYCCNMTHTTVQNHFGGKLEEFCTEECMSLYTVLFYEMAKCFWCKTQGTLNESLKWDGTIKHFCNLRCVLQFCCKSVVPDQPNSNGITTAATAAQAPLSLSKDMPVIGGVVSLASALAGNTALTGALPTSHASSKIIGDASTQTDAAVNVGPNQRRMLKNKALMCKPIIEEQGIQCQLQPPEPLFETVIDENGDKVRLVPVPVPIPMPVYIPVPMHLYTQLTPVPLGLPLPVPVPVVITDSGASTQHSVTKGSVPSQSSVEDEDAEKSKDRPVSRDQGSTYSGDLESEARSTPFSWADAEDSSQLHKPSPVTSTPVERPTSAPAAPTSPSPLDLEKDIPVASNDHAPSKEQKSPKRRKRGRRGRRRLGTDAANSSSSSKIHHVYGVKAWASWVQWRAQQTEVSPLTVKEDVSQCSSAELSDGLCHFISEVRRPNGQAYAPDSVYYLCLGIQQYLLEHGQSDNIFMDPPYSKFTTDLTRLLKDREHTLPPSGFLQSRVEESFLWECKQLGTLSPFVLLNTLLFFGVKLLNLKTVEQHQRLSFSNVVRCSTTTAEGTTSYLRFRLNSEKDEVPEKQDQGAVVLGKRKREEEDDEDECEDYLEMWENTENPLHCPVRLYDFYLSKCSDSVQQRSDIFYLQPDGACEPSSGSSRWFSSEPLQRTVLESMLTRILAVRDVHLDPVLFSDSSDEESS